MVLKPHLCDGSLSSQTLYVMFDCTAFCHLGSISIAFSKLQRQCLPLAILASTYHISCDTYQNICNDSQPYSYAHPAD